MVCASRAAVRTLGTDSCARHAPGERGSGTGSSESRRCAALRAGLWLHLVLWFVPETGQAWLAGWEGRSHGLTARVRIPLCHSLCWLSPA